MNVKYHVELSQSELDQLHGLLRGERHASRRLKRAQNFSISFRAVACSALVSDSSTHIHSPQPA